MTWYVGQRVVCVKEARNEYRRSAEKEIDVKKGTVYTIRHVRKSVVHEGFSFLFEEIKNPILSYREGFAEMAFPDFRFRPIDESKIDCLREHLTKVPKSVKEDA